MRCRTSRASASPWAGPIENAARAERRAWSANGSPAETPWVIRSSRIHRRETLRERTLAHLQTNRGAKAPGRRPAASFQHESASGKCIVALLVFCQLVAVGGVEEMEECR